MLTTRHLIRHLIVKLVGTGLVLVSLFGGLTVPAASASGVEPTTYRGYGNHRGYRGYHDYRGYRHYRSYRWPRYRSPDRFTIRKGRKCELRCQRVWGTRDYSCREYRC
jgi:hypothetical protein